jgi:hypothetical protein
MMHVMDGINWKLVMNRKINYLLVALFCLATQSLRAADVRFDGAPSFSIAKSKVTIVAPRIVNNSPTNSGLLRLQVRATTTPFTGPDTEGYVIATRGLGSLGSGADLSVSNAVNFVAPPNGQYYTTMTLEEFAGGQWVVREFINYPNLTTFSTDAQLSLDGAASWRVTGGALHLQVDKVSNYATSGRSRPLRLELWGTAAPYAGGELIDDQNAYLLGATGLAPVAGGFSHNNVKRATRLLAPPDGYLYTTLVLSEWDGSTWVRKDFNTFPNPSFFGGSSADAPKLDLQGPVSWTLVGNNVKIRADKIVSSRVTGVSGPLELQLWASTSAYNGGTFDGFVLTSAKAGKVSGGGNMHNITKVGRLTLPPDGEYFTTIALVETTPTGPVVQDFIPLGSTITLNRKMLGGLSSTGVAGTGTGVEMQGRTTYAIRGNDAHITVAKVVNNRADVTGQLRLGLWMTADPYVEGPVNGAKVAERILGRLAFGASYLDISGAVPYNKPAAGNYYPLITLEENQNGEWKIVDSVTFNRRITLR